MDEAYPCEPAYPDYRQAADGKSGQVSSDLNLKV